VAAAEKAAKIKADELEAEKVKIAAAKLAAEKAAKIKADEIAAAEKATAKKAAELAVAEKSANERAAKIKADEIAATERAIKVKTETPTNAPTPAIQTAPSIAATDGIQLVSSKPGIELDNSITAVPLDATTYKPGATVRFDGMLINEGVPPFSFVDINGKEIRQPDLLGKVVYIDFWATWCAPCKEHIRYIQSTIEETKDKDIVYLFISVDKDPSKWRNYVKDNNLGGIHVNDQQGLVSMYWNIQALPNYFLLGKDGRVAINSFIKSKKTLEDMIKYLLATNYQGEKR
jgi:thiol-disulfide isomerase/thioredoxin